MRFSSPSRKRSPIRIDDRRDSRRVSRIDSRRVSRIDSRLSPAIASRRFLPNDSKRYSTLDSRKTSINGSRNESAIDERLSSMLDSRRISTIRPRREPIIDSRRISAVDSRHALTVESRRNPKIERDRSRSLRRLSNLKREENGFEIVLSSSRSKKEVFYILEDECFLSPKYRTTMEVFGLQFLSIEHHLMYNQLLSLKKKEKARSLQAKSDIKHILEFSNTFDFDLVDSNWNKTAWKCLLEACLVKFKTNERYREYLFRTIGSTIVYKSSKSSLLGVTIEKGEGSLTVHPRDMKGENLYGEVLMAVRDFLFEGVKFQREKKDAMKKAYALKVLPNLFD